VTCNGAHRHSYHPDIADPRRVAVNTLETQVSSVYGKLATSSPEPLIKACQRGLGP
jgi:hypothetical protein